MRTIIHIGQHKTGTTSIQNFLRNKRRGLAKEGLYVPDSLVGCDNPSHFLLNVYSLHKNRFSSTKEKLLATNPPEYFVDLEARLRNDISKHYRIADQQGCRDVIWSNEGLYLLNSPEEYKRLFDLFAKHSSVIVCVCCFRDVESYRTSYMKQLMRQRIGFSEDKDSYRYVKPDSWLFDYKRKEEILKQVFENVICFPYNEENNVKCFMGQIGYSAADADAIRLNVS